MSTGVWLERRRAPHALARAAAATAVVVPGACAAHTWAGGSLPTLPGLVLVTAVVLALPPQVADPGEPWLMVGAHLGVTLLTSVLWWAGQRWASVLVSFPERCGAGVVARVRACSTSVRTSGVRTDLLVSPRRGPPPATRPT